MQSVVSLLDHKHNQLVKILWAELARELALAGVYTMPYPHLSYHVGRRYDVAALNPVLQRFAASRSPFHIRTSGLGIFTGPQPVLCLTVVRSPELTQVHEALWPQISSSCSGTLDYYHPAHWMPHITIAEGDLNEASLSGAVRLLAKRDFHWEITVDNIALMYDSLFEPFAPTMLGDQSWYLSTLKKLHVYRFSR